jgi:hypothetical protein
MEEWQNEIAAVLKDVTELFDGFGRELTEFVEEVTTGATEILYLRWDELKEVLTEIWQDLELEFEESTPINWDIPIHTRPMPDPAVHPACVGCINYNGSTYGGNLLVCGIYPFGCNNDTCADWEGENDLN